MQSANLICFTFIIWNVLLVSAKVVFRYDSRETPFTGLSSKPKGKDSSVIHFPRNDIFPETSSSKGQMDQKYLVDQLNLAKKLYEGKKDAVISPYLLTAALDILKSGMDSYDCFKMPEAAKTLTTLATYQKNARNSHISLATYLYKRSGLTYQRSFKSHIDYLGVNQTNIEGDIQKMADRINEQVNESTKGLIPEIANKEMFTNDTTLVLLNTIYFKADWETPFNKEVDGVFAIGNLEKRVRMMELIDLSQSSIRGLESSKHGLYQFPYNDHRTSMFVVMPKKSSLEYLSFKEIAKGMSMVSKLKYESVKMPKMDHSIDLDVLNTNIGKNCLRPANYGKFFTNQGSIELSAFIHKAKLITSLNGTEATGSSVASFDFRTFRHTLLINRPFLYFVHDSQTDAILFYGTYNNPPV